MTTPAPTFLPGVDAPELGFDAPLTMLQACHDRLHRSRALLREIGERLSAGRVDGAVQGAAAEVLHTFDRAAVMAGYDGHRGWVNYLAVAPGQRLQGHARTLMGEVERLLTAAGCAKLNLQIRTTNAAVIAFYRRLGYAQDEVVSFGRRLIPDAPAR